MMLLIIVTDCHIAAQANLTCIGGHKFIDYFQDGGLAGAVITDNSHMFPFFDIEIQVLKQREGAERFREILHMQDIVAAGILGFQPKVHIGADLCRFLKDFNLV